MLSGGVHGWTCIEKKSISHANDQGRIAGYRDNRYQISSFRDIYGSERTLRTCEESEFRRRKGIPDVKI
jgi:hypothetical protein